MRGVASCALALALPRPVKADLFGDIGVLLAQLEQQLQLVSHAISTVTNLIRTVEHLGNVVKNSSKLLERAGNGGLLGILDAAQGFVSVGRGVTSNLRMINADAGWWKSKLEPIFNSTSDATPQTVATMKSASLALRDIDKRRLQQTADMNEAYGRLQGSYDSLKASGDAVNDALRTEGVVGQMQLAGRQIYHHTAVAVHQDEMLTDLARRNNEELVRMAAQRELNRKLVEGAMRGLGDKTQESPVRDPVGTAIGGQ